MQKKYFLIYYIFLFITLCSCSSKERLYKITIKHGKQCGFIDYNGEMVIPADYSYVYNFTEDWACVEKDDQTIYIDKNNKIVLMPEVKNAMPFSEGYAVASKGLKYGFINKKGKIVIPITYDYAKSFKNNVSWVRNGDKWLCINKRNEVLFSDNYKDVNDFNNDYAVVISKQDEKYLINKSNKRINIPVGYTIYQDYVDENYEILLKKDDLVFIYNLKTKELTEKQYSYKVFYDKSKQKYGLKDKNEKIVIEPLYDYLSRPDEKGFVLCGIGEEWNDMKFGYLSTEGEILIPIIFYQLDFFDDDMAVFLPRSVDGGYVRRDGKVFYAKDYL